MNQAAPPQMTMGDPGMMGSGRVNQGIGYIQDTPAGSVGQNLSPIDRMNPGQGSDSHMDPQGLPVGMPVADWTAVSVTVLVQP